MVEYKDHYVKRIVYGENKDRFIEIGVRTSTNENGDSRTFIGMNRGYINKDKEDRFLKGGFSLPIDKKFMDKLTGTLTDCLSVEIPKQKQSKTESKKTKESTTEGNKQLQKQLNDMKEKMEEQNEVNTKLLEFITKQSKKGKKDK